MPYLQRDQISLYWESLGKGEPIAFLNGVLMTVDSWKLQTLKISQRYRCVMHDFRGQLQSTKPETPWTMEDHSRDLKALLDHLGIDKCHVVGTSYGGEVGMIFAASWPERVRSLTVIASVCEVGPDTERTVLDWQRAALEAPMSLYRTMLPTTFSREFVAENPGLIEQAEARLKSCDEDFFKAFSGLIDAFCELDITPILGEICCPTLVIAGENDLLKPPKYSRIIAAGIRDSELLVIPGAGHAVVLEQAELINQQLTRFIGQHQLIRQAAE